MSLLSDRLKNAETQKQVVHERVAQNMVRPTESEAEIVRRLAKRMASEFRDDLSAHGLTESVKERIRSAIYEAAKLETGDYEQQVRIAQLACNYVVGLGPLEGFMADPEITEIIVQRFDNICVERAGVMYHVNASFSDEQQLQSIINRIVQPVGRQINLSTPIVDARLSDGSRVNATIPPVTPDGATLSIRKFSNHALTGEHYLSLGSLSENMLEFLSAAVRGKVSIIVSGGTSTGKTTLLNMLSSYIPENELIVTIEDSCELQLRQANVRRMETRQSAAEGLMPITTQTLVKNALRMRPDRIIVGEIRDGTVVDMMSAMSTGHEGSMSTVHANNPGNLVNSRLPILYGMNDYVKFSVDTQSMQVAEAIQLIVHISRLQDGRRKITHITEVTGLTEKSRVKLTDIFRYDSQTDAFAATGYVPEKIVDRMATYGVHLDSKIFAKEA